MLPPGRQYIADSRDVTQADPTRPTQRRDRYNRTMTAQKNHPSNLVVTGICWASVQGPGSPGLFMGTAARVRLQVDLLRTALPVRRNTRRGRLNVRLRRSPQGDVGQKDGSRQTAQSEGLPRFQQDATSRRYSSTFMARNNNRVK